MAAPSAVVCAPAPLASVASAAWESVHATMGRPARALFHQVNIFCFDGILIHFWDTITYSVSPKLRTRICIPYKV